MHTPANLGSLGIGIDIEEVSRFYCLDRERDDAFLAKVFTSKELDYCYSKERRAEHLAARFAGKEAVIKAVGDLTGQALAHGVIEILSERGAPRVQLAKGAGKDLVVKVSLSHTFNYAVALAIAQRVG
ncbi:MAG: holo-ACP synthase [Euryarchaeota archaeon]|nr:holo-ACP synthase [Euryarchaeota archaeon]